MTMLAKYPFVKIEPSICFRNIVCIKAVNTKGLDTYNNSLQVQ